MQLEFFRHQTFVLGKRRGQLQRRSAHFKPESRSDRSDTQGANQWIWGVRNLAYWIDRLRLPLCACYVLQTVFGLFLCNGRYEVPGIYYGQCWLCCWAVGGYLTWQSLDRDYFSARSAEVGSTYSLHTYALFLLSPSKVVCGGYVFRSSTFLSLSAVLNMHTHYSKFHLL